MRHPQGSGSVGMPFFISLYVVSFLLLKKKKSIDNHLIINAFNRVGMTGFEPATSRPPDDYYKSHYNLDYQCNAYLPFLLGLSHGLNRIN